MSDYRNLDDPSRRDPPSDLNARTGASGWIAGGVFLVIILGLAFGVGHMPNHGNNTPATNTSAPATQPAPSGPAGRTYSPTPMSPVQGPTQSPAPNPGSAQP